MDNINFFYPMPALSWQKTAEGQNDFDALIVPIQFGSPITIRTSHFFKTFHFVEKNGFQLGVFATC